MDNKNDTQKIEILNDEVELLEDEEILENIPQEKPIEEDINNIKEEKVVTITLYLQDN